MNEDKAGYFTVKLISENGDVEARLTGDHFVHDEDWIAKSVASEDGKRSVVDGGSPVYLVRDAETSLAVGAARKAAKRVSECHDGPKGSPCCKFDKCKLCRTAMSNAFTFSMLSCMALPEGELSDRLRESLSSVIGLAWMRSEWAGEMSDEDVDLIFTRMKVKNNKEGEKK